MIKIRLLAATLLLLFASAAAFAQTQTASTASEMQDAQYIPPNSKVYIAPFKSENTEKPVTGFESYIAAAMRKKKVPLIMVNDRSLADFEIAGTADKKGAGTAKKILLGDFRSTTSASITVTNIHTGVIAYADSSHKYSANRGLRSAAEKLAKYLRQKMERDEKRAGHKFPV